MQKVAYGGWKNCIRLSNGSIELVVTTDVGPRIIRFGFAGSQNLFFEKKDELGQTGGDEWKIYGGHRFWHAPEAVPRTYSPDNSPVEYGWSGGTLKLLQAREEETGIRKEMEVHLDAGQDRVQVLHRAINDNPWAIELAPWCLTAMAPGGRAILPQEEYRPHPQFLAPARPLVLWHYTDMADPRWSWGTRYIQLRQSSSTTSKEKIGILNTPGWAAYTLKGELFIKRFAFEAGAEYPDFGSNTEVFTDPAMLEIESLGPITLLPPSGGRVEFREDWFLHRVEVGSEESDIDVQLLPLLRHSADQRR
ncbi:MAG: hypothetical protein ACE5JX_05055 [Acidobacteriota bacterium]